MATIALALLVLAIAAHLLYLRARLGLIQDRTSRRVKGPSG
jgi:hypothetical protein